MIVKYVALIFGAIFEIYCINTFSSIFSKRKEINKLHFLIIITIISLFHILTSVFLKGISLAICSLLTVFIINQLYKSKQYVKIVLTIGISAINIASELAVNGVLMIINSNNYLDTNSEPQLFSLGLLLSKFVAFVIIIIFKIGKRKFNVNNLNSKYLILLSVLPITTIFIGILMYQVILIIDTVSLKIVFVFANMLLIVSNIIAFEIIRNQNNLAKAKYELELLKGNVNEQMKHYNDLKSSHEEIRQLRHNMRSICIGAIAELKAGKTENALEQLQNSISIIEKSSKVIDTGHLSIDSIIENKLNCCSDFNISTNLTYQYKDPITINEIEIAVILGNILDNAIEACQKITDTNKEIWGSISVDKRNIIINIKNTAIDSNNLKTSKINKKDHGYGLKSISHIAKKYNGYATFSFSDSIFTSYVISEN